MILALAQQAEDWITGFVCGLVLTVMACYYVVDKIKARQNGWDQLDRDFNRLKKRESRQPLHPWYPGPPQRMQHSIHSTAMAQSVQIERDADSVLSIGKGMRWEGDTLVTAEEEVIDWAAKGWDVIEKTKDQASIDNWKRSMYDQRSKRKKVRR